MFCTIKFPLKPSIVLWPGWMDGRYMGFAAAQLYAADDAAGDAPLYWPLAKGHIVRWIREME